MKVQVKDGKNCEKVLKIELDEARIKEELEGIYKDITPRAKIPGFRPGKAPKDVIAMHYRGEAREQALKNLLNDSYRQAIQENSLQPLGYPEVTDVQFDDASLSYKAVVEVRPRIKLSKVKGLSVKKETAEVKDSDIDERLKQIQESHAQFKAVEDRPAKMGDFLIADYTCTVEGKEVDKRTEDWFELKKDDFLKGFSEQLVGANAGDEKEVKITFPEDFGRKEFSGKEALFAVKVKEVKKKQLPEINDDLARETGDSESLAELKEKIRKQVQEEKQKAVDAEFEKKLLEELVKKNKIDLPPRVIEKRIDYMIDQARQHMAQQGGAEEEFEKNKDKMREGFRPEAEKQIHISFLLDEIAVKEEITVNEEDLKKRVEALAQRFRQPVENVEKYYTENPDALETLRDQVRNEKTIDFIKENAK